MPYKKSRCNVLEIVNIKPSIRVLPGAFDTALFFWASWSSEPRYSISDVHTHHIGIPETTGIYSTDRCMQAQVFIEETDNRLSYSLSDEYKPNVTREKMKLLLMTVIRAEVFEVRYFKRNLSELIGMYYVKMCLASGQGSRVNLERIW